MGNLVTVTSFSEITATIEVLSSFGVEQNHLKELRSDHELADGVAQFLRNLFLRKIFFKSFAYYRASAVNQLLSLLKPKLSEVEKRYVEESGPEIRREHLKHAMLTEVGGCPEGREARRRAAFLEERASEKLTNAGVSSQRQKLLRDLLYIGDMDALQHYYPKSVADIRGVLLENYKSGLLSEFVELSEALDAPCEVKDFLNLLFKYAEKAKADEQSLR